MREIVRKPVDTMDVDGFFELGNCTEDPWNGYGESREEVMEDTLEMEPEGFRLFVFDSLKEFAQAVIDNDWKLNNPY